MKIYYLTFILFYILNLVQTESNLDCLRAENCSSCIRIVNCAWCLDERFQSISGRKCDYPQILFQDGCPSNLIFNPINTVEIIEELELDQEKNSPNTDVSFAKTNSFKDLINNKTILSRSNRNQLSQRKKRNLVNQEDKLVQLKPDKIKLKVRPNTKVRFNLTFNQAEKYPVDVYYLMDLTYSMKDHRDALIKQAEKISESMSDITTKFRLGFGSFVDKVTMPYSNMLPQKLENPCNQNIPCVRAYGYKNHLSLTNDSKLFLEKVKEAKLSGNLDNAEGGFDALIQIIACKNQIKWNHFSRKIILFATDSLFHYAGDGKLGGIVKKNDGQCHLSNDGYYTESLHQDYPSLEQINKAIVNNQINIIFSVPENSLKVYELLAENLQGSITGRLAENSSNIVDLIRENYKKIVSTIELKDDSPKNVEIKYFSRCSSTSSSLKETNMCKDVVVGQKLQFEIELEVKSCEQSRTEKNTKFVIYPLFGIEEKTEIELELICDCDCETKAELKSDFCFGNGNLKCGICECDDSAFFGDKCQCSQNNLTSSSFIDECKINNVICSNKGQCLCGKCLCDDKSKDGLIVYGKHCECDDYSCPKSNGLTCGGRGRCCNKKCECISGWSGDTCECSNDQSTCISPINNKICSGNGECLCGKCHCKRTQSSEIWSGRYCNECPTCTDECAMYDPCALCVAFDAGPYKSSQNCKENCKFNTKIVKEFSYLSSNKTFESDRLKLLSTNSSLKNSQETGNDFESSLIKRCIMIDEDNCKYEFTIIYVFKENTERIFIEVLKDKICPNEQNIFYFNWFISIVIFIILIGLLSLIIWRAIVSYKDKKDYEKWINYLKTREFTSTGQNPLYKEPTTQIKNPLYQSKNEN